MDLTWDPLTADDLAGYRVYRAASDTGPWTQLTTDPITDTSYEATGVSNNTWYWFQVPLPTQPATSPTPPPR